MHFLTLQLKLMLLQLGQYRANISTSTASKIEVFVTSKPTSASAEIIRPLVKLSYKALDFLDKKAVPVMYIYLRKGESPVKNANITILVDGPLGNQICTMIARDDGVRK